MSEPVTVDIPHKLGKTEARSRIENGLGKLASFVPGGTVSEHRWDGDRLAFTVRAMGQSVAAQLEIFDDRIHASFALPAMLSMLANKAKDLLLKGGQKLLE